MVFPLVILLTVVVRRPLDSIGLLHTPKLAIMMIVVIFSLLIIALLSNLPFMEIMPSINSTALFPIAILTITSGPNDAYIKYQRGKVYYLSGDYKQAISDYETALLSIKGNDGE